MIIYVIFCADKFRLKIAIKAMCANRIDTLKIQGIDDCSGFRS
jgi:hypothetical protein